jgi:RND family efflux transporter MFP subunit
VTTGEIREVEWPSIYEATGTVRARVSTTVAARAMGYIREIRAQAGDAVRAGQLLAVIDSRELEAGVRQAEAAVDEAHSGIAEADNAIASAKAQMELANTTFRRMQELYDKKSISDQEYDEAKSRQQVARAGHEMALAKRRQLDAKIRQAEQAVAAVRVTRGYSEVRAPFAGIVTAKLAEQGDMATPGRPLLTLEQASGYQLEAQLEEGRLGTIRAGQRVSVVLDAFGRTVESRVAEVIPTIDPASRSFTVKVPLPTIAGMHSGLFGRARFVLASRQAIAVPESSIVANGQVRTVYVVDNGVARARMVSLGERNGGMVEILSGVTNGDRVVRQRPAQLTDGAKVEVGS